MSHRFVVLLAAALTLVGSRAVAAEVIRTITRPMYWSGPGRLVALKDGRALLVGGARPTDRVPGSNLFDPRTETWSQVAAMNRPRTGLSAVTLPSGRVLVTGGVDSAGGVSSAELYDPATNTWTLAGSTARPVLGPLILLTDGRVAVVDGGVTLTEPATFDLFDPATNTWTVGPQPARLHQEQLAFAALPGGDALLASQVGVERYKSGASWTVIASTPHPIAAVSLRDSRVFLFGGTTTAGGGVVFDPATNDLRAITGQRRGAGAVAAELSDGRVLIAGGAAVEFGVALQLEWFDPSRNALVPFATSSASLRTASALALSEGRALVIDHDRGDTLIITPPKGCITAAECETGFCADGLCCDTACTGQCEACDVAGQLGTCTGVKGVPRGARSECSPSWTPACRALSCDPTRSRTECVKPVFPPPCDCARDDECATGHCADGVCCNNACDGQCEACDLPDSRGVCNPVTGEPRGIRKGCPVPGAGICSVQACDGKEPTRCVYIHGAQTDCASICGGRVQRHCNGAGLCGLPNEMQCPDTACSVPSAEPPGPPRIVDAILVVALGALIKRARRTRR
jgi:hypothetical protein